MRRRLFAVAALLTVLAIGSSAVQAVPPVAPSFWGIVGPRSSGVGLESVASAWINGIKYAEYPVIWDQSRSQYIYTIQVPGDDSDSPEKVEGGVPGDTITFMVDGRAAAQTGTWVQGAVVHLDLTIPPPPGWHYIRMPLVFHGPDSTQ